MRRSTAEQLAIESRRSQVAGLFLQGVRRQGELAERLGVDRSTISRDLKVLDARWQQSGVRDLDAAKGQELDRIDLIEREAWEAWEKSKKGRETTTTEQTTGGDCARTKAGIRKEEEHGDPRYMDIVQWCSEQRRKLLGLNAPTETRLTGQGGGPIRTATEVTGHVDLFARVAQYVPVLRQLRERDGGGHGPGAAGPGGGGRDGGLPAGAVPGERLQEPLAAAPADAEAGGVPVPDGR
jgi:hypothetical protein